MTRIASSTLVFALFCFAATGCAHRHDAVASNQQSYETMRAETDRAFELERRADVVIDYEWSDRIRLWTPPQTAYASATDETLASALSSATTNRGLAVVIIGKPVRHAFPEPHLSTKVDAIEAVVRAQGFKRVVFQLASAFGRPIYRE